MTQCDERDGALFAFAALYNSAVTHNKAVRGALEGKLSRLQRSLYVASCRHLAKKYPGFDAGPAIESLYDDSIKALPVAAYLREEDPALSALRSRFDSMAAQIKTLSSTVLWGFVAMGGLFYWLR